MSAKSELLVGAEAEFQGLKSAIAGLSEADMREVWCGTWSVREILSHISGWHREMLPGVERLARGEKPFTEGVSYSDFDAWNAKFAYSDSPGVDYFPRTVWCLLGSKARGKNTPDNNPDRSAWLNFRAYALFASHLLNSQREFNDMFGLRDAPNKEILRDWNREDLDYLFAREGRT